MITFRVDHCNPSWDRHLVVASDNQITIDFAFDWIVEKLKAITNIHCYGWSRLDQLGTPIRTPIRSERNEIIAYQQNTELYGQYFCFAGTLFGPSEQLVSLLKDLEKQIQLLNTTKKK